MGSRTKSWSFARAVSVLNPWTISSAHPFNVCWCVCVVCIWIFICMGTCVYEYGACICRSEENLGCQSSPSTSFESLYLNYHCINQTSWSISFQDFSVSASHLAVDTKGWGMNAYVSSGDLFSSLYSWWHVLKDWVTSPAHSPFLPAFSDRVTHRVTYWSGTHQEMKLGWLSSESQEFLVSTSPELGFYYYVPPPSPFVIS